jgi:hypothetical protein
MVGNLSTISDIGLIHKVQLDQPVQLKYDHTYRVVQN